MKALPRRHPAARLSRRPPHVFRPRLELLEGRWVPAGFPATVNTTAVLPATAFLNGNNIVIASAVLGNSPSIVAQRLDASGDLLGSPIAVASSGVAAGVGSIGAAGDGTGNFLIAWPVSQTTNGITSTGVQAQLFDLNGVPQFTQLPELLFPAPNAAGAGGNTTVYAHTAMNSQGAFVLVEDTLTNTVNSSGFTSTDRAEVQEFSSSGQPLGTAPFPLVNTTGAFGVTASNPVVALDDAGNFVAVWIESNQLVFQLFDAAAIPSPSTPKPVPIAGAIGDTSGYSVAMDPAGAFVITWANGNTSTTPGGVFAQLFDARGNARGTPIAVAPNKPVGSNGQFATFSQPQVGMDATGNFVVAFDNDSGVSGGTTSHAISAQQFNQAGVPVSSLLNVEPPIFSSPSTSQFFFDSPSLAENEAGSFAVSWDLNASPDSGGDQRGVQVNLFPATPGPTNIPDVTVLKTADQAIVSAGQTAGFTVTITNTGTGTATGVTLADFLPAGDGNDINWQIDTGTGDPNDFAISGSAGFQFLTLATGVDTLGAGQSLTVHITGVTSFDDAPAPSFSGFLFNDATVNASNEPPADQNQQSFAIITVVAPDVTVLKTADQPTINAGQTAGFTVTVSNIGAGTANGVTLNDFLPAGAGTDINWQIDGTTGDPNDFAISGSAGFQFLTLATGVNTLSAGQSLTVHITGLTSFDDAAAPSFSGFLFNDATVNASNEPPADQDQQSFAIITVVAPDVTVLKTADQPIVSAGQTAGFTVTVSNIGAGTATGVTLDDFLPAGDGNDVNWQIDGTTGDPGDFAISGSVGFQFLTLAAGIDTLDAGQSLTVHITGLTSFADAPAPSFSGFLFNDATVNASNEAAADQDQQSFAIITVVAPDVTVLKTADQDTVDAGDSAGFTVTVSNIGAGTATDVTLDDFLPAGTGNDINWQIDTGTGDPNDFAISGSVGFQFLTLAAGVDTLDAGQSLTVHITGLTSFADAPAPSFSGFLFNDATVNASNESPADQDQQSFAIITVVAPDVTVLKTADQDTVDAGASAGFTVTITNTGAGTASGVTLNDFLPAGAGNDVNWQIDTGTGDPNDFAISGSVGFQFLTLATGVDTLSAGQSLTVHITGLTSFADAPAPSFSGFLFNDATVNASNEAAADQDQQSFAIVTVIAPDVTVEKFADQATIDAGQTAGFTVLIFNDSAAPANGVALSDPLPAGLGNDVNWQIDTSTGNPGDFAISGAVGNQTLTLAPGLTTLAANAFLAVHITGVTSFADAPAPFFIGVLQNTAVVTVANESPVSASSSVTIVAPDVDVSNTSSIVAFAGQFAEFTVDVVNEGQAVASGVTLSNPLPAGAGSDINWQIAGNAASFVITGPVGDQTLALAPTLSTLAPGDFLTVDIRGRTSTADAPPPTFQAILPSTATVNATNEAPSEQNDQATASVLVLRGTPQPTPPPTPTPTPTPSPSSPFSSNNSSGNGALLVAALEQTVAAPPMIPAAPINDAAPLPLLAAPPPGLAGAGEVAVMSATLSGVGGVARVGDISGMIFLDRNGDGVREPGETGIAGLTLFIDLHGDGRFYPDDPYTVTNHRGEYVFHDLPLNRTYQVRPLPQQYLAQTYPKQGAAQVVQLSDDHPTETDVTFGTVPFKPATPPVRPVRNPETDVPAPQPGKSDGDESRNDAPPEASDAVFQLEGFWRPAAVPLALVVAVGLGLDRRRRRSPGQRREESV